MVRIVMTKKSSESESNTIELKFKGNDLVIINIPNSEVLEDIKKIALELLDIGKKSVKIKPCYHQYVIEYLEKKNIEYKQNFPSKFYIDNKIEFKFAIRSYQNDAYYSWRGEDRLDFSLKGKGVVILPTGAGKTYLGLFTIQKENLRSLIVVPTLDLMDQWYTKIIDFIFVGDKNINNNNKSMYQNDTFNINNLVGRFGGGYKDVKPITITTYDSGYLYLNKFRNQFGLLIFDEVHHLAGEKYRLIAEGSIAPYRLGLTATLEKDENYSLIEKLVGKVVYQKKPSELTKLGQLASYSIKKIEISLSKEKQHIYKKEQEKYVKYLKSFSKNPFQQMIYRANTDTEAKEALFAYRKSREIALNAEEKIPKIELLFKNHIKDRIILFCENIAFVENLSRLFFIPALTSNTPTSERKRIISKFSKGDYRILAAGKLLDEGMDFPEANVGIIVSGTGVKRQHIQRLGRLLRPFEGKKAILYELVTKNTTETRLSSQRKIKSNNE